MPRTEEGDSAGVGGAIGEGGGDRGGGEVVQRAPSSGAAALSLEARAKEAAARLAINLG